MIRPDSSFRPRPRTAGRADIALGDIVPMVLPPPLHVNTNIHIPALVRSLVNSRRTRGKGTRRKNCGFLTGFLRPSPAPAKRHARNGRAGEVFRFGQKHDRRASGIAHGRVQRPFHAGGPNAIHSRREASDSESVRCRDLRNNRERPPCPRSLGTPSPNPWQFPLWANGMMLKCRSNVSDDSIGCDFLAGIRRQMNHCRRHPRCLRRECPLTIKQDESWVRL